MTTEEKLRAAMSALREIEAWGPFPNVTLHLTLERVPYGVAYGSNGERDYMRNVARETLKRIDEDSE